MCEDFTAPTFQLLQVHLFRVHSGDFDVNCCNKKFRTASAYRKHVQRNHNCAESSSSSLVVSECDHTSASWDPEDGDSDQDHGCSFTSCLSGHSQAMWILKLKESHKLTQACMERVLQDVSELCTVTVAELGDAVKSTLNSAGINFDHVPGLSELFTTSSTFSQPFNGLLTYHHQLKFYSTHLNFVVSIKHNPCKYIARPANFLVYRVQYV